MPTHQAYQNNNYKKNINSKNSFSKGKISISKSVIDGEWKDKLKSWITLYRTNPSIFAEHYLGVRLFPYQRYWLDLMSKSTNFLGVASRASAKSWLIALYSICRCILYPGTQISINSSTKLQAGLILSEKCQQLFNEHPNIRRETKNIVNNPNIHEMTFHNGSRIFVVVSGEAGRGNRSTVAILEERRLIPTDIIDSIIRPFLVSRMPPYMKESKYISLQEEPVEIIITSAFFKSHDWYLEAKKLLKMIANGDLDVRAIFLDYLITLRHGIKTKKQLAKEKIKMDSISFLQEYGNIPYSSSSDSFLKVGFFNRSMKIAWHPANLNDPTSKKNSYDIKRKNGERRIVSVDFAFRKGAANDNTVITCARIFPTSKGYNTEICYIESHNGKNALLQALRIKQIYQEFSGFYDGDGLILDVAGSGITVFDALSGVTKDDILGREYDAMNVMRNSSIDKDVFEELNSRCLGKDAIPCIYPISASQSLNSQIAVSFRDRLKRKLIKFLIDENEAEDFFLKSGNKDILNQEDISLKANLLIPYIQTTLLINECIALEMIPAGLGLIKLKEPSGGRKDRYTSASYLNWYVSLLDKELLKDGTGKSDEESILAVTMVY